ncbi:MAG: GDSL-type esterase/lipase family protein [Rubripirellula sp.]
MTVSDSTAVTASQSPQKLFVRLMRAARTLCVVSLFFAALLSYPSVLPWMTAAWLAWHTVMALRGRAGYQPLVACLVVLIVHLVAPTPWMLVFAVTLALLAVYRWRNREARQAGVIGWWWGLSALWLSWALMVWEYRSIENAGRVSELRSSAPVVCIGDSLTQGLLPDRGYPEQLKSMIERPVINLGFSGIATSQGLDQLDRVLEHQPQVVVIELGGHDFLKGHSRSSTKQNLTDMIEACRDRGCDVILMEIPRGFMVDPFACVERQIAYEQDVQLVSDTWLRQIVTMSPIAPPGRWMPESHLSDDGIHSNQRGSKAIAMRVRDALKKMYGEAIVTRRP